MSTARLLTAITVGTVIMTFLFYIGRSQHRGDKRNILNPQEPQRDETPVANAPLYNDSTDVKHLSIGEHIQHGNLSIYLIKGKATMEGKKYVVLHEAMKNKQVTVKETGEVNQLKLDNNSSDYIYINSGDIVRGGKQDRTIQYDVIIPPKKKNVDLASFCVEHGRWTSRGNEQVGSFASSEKSLSSKELKVAAKYAKNQGDVWKKVDKYQRKANDNLSKANDGQAPVDVKSAVSATSLELTLDNELIAKKKQEYRQQILSRLSDRSEALGFAYFINGKLYGVDVYNNHKLFNDLFEKLLDAAIAEAVSEESQEGQQAPTVADLREVLNAEAQVYSEEEVNEITKVKTAECNDHKNIVIFTTADKEVKNWLHRNWLDKTES